MMSCELNPHILEYIELVENGIACEEQKALAAHVRKCFETEEIYVDTEQLEKYLGLAKYFSFEKLFPWEEFLIALWDCTYWKSNNRPRWKIVPWWGVAQGRMALLPLTVRAASAHTTL